MSLANYTGNCCPTKFADGTDGQVLGVSSGVPAWVGASGISLSDASDYFASDNVESALQELGSQALPDGTVIGQSPYWDGTKWIASPYLMLAGVIRGTSGVWSFVGGAHTYMPSTMTVQVQSNHVRVLYGHTFSRVVSFVAKVDEVYASLGWQVGSGVGLSYAEIYMYDTAGVLQDPNLAQPAASNIWFIGIMEI